MGQSVRKIIVGSAHVKNIDHRGKETCAMFDLPIQNKNSAINVLLLFLFDLFVIITVCLT